MVKLAKVEVERVQQELVEKICKDEILEILLLDATTILFNFERTFKILLPSRDEWANEIPSFEENTFVFYTDGWVYDK